jgi:sec-independent protein translocase protein TatC
MSAEPAALADDGRMTLWEHLAELRSRLIKSIAAVAIGAVVGWIVFPWALEFLLEPYRDINPDAALYVQDPLEPFAVRIKVSGYLGVMFAMPVLLWQVWRFVTPGLYPHEKKYAVPFVVSALVLFVFGAGIAYYTLPAALEFLSGIAGDDVEEIYSPQRYLTLIVYMMLAFGAGFEFPVLLVALQLVGVLTPRQLLGWWRWAIVLIVVIAAVITPSGDPISLMALSLPMVLLYFAAIGIGALFTRRKRKGRAGASAGSGSGSGSAT